MQGSEGFDLPYTHMVSCQGLDMLACGTRGLGPLCPRLQG